MKLSKKLIQASVVLLLFIVLPIQLSAQKESDLYDTDSKIETRSSDTAEKLRENKAFDYDREYAEPPEGLLKRIQYWIYRFFMKVSEGGPVAWLFYGILIVVLIIVLAQLMGFKYDALLLRNKNLKHSDIEVFDEDIHSMDISQLIQDAIEQKDYRKATRYAYLKLLKNLDTNNLIEWQPDKTNRDYYREMRNSKYNEEFHRLTRTYEYVWYGEFDLNQEQFEYTYKVFGKVYKELAA